MTPYSRVFLVVLALVFFLHSSVEGKKGLDRYNIDTDTITVSGMSAGGFMAVQLQIIFSKVIHGAGIVAGGPFYCAQGSAARATSACTFRPNLINQDLLVNATRQFAQDGLIDPLHNLAQKRMLLFSGTLDSIVKPGVVEKLALYLRQVGIRDEHLETHFDTPAEHAMISDEWGNKCKFLGFPFINNCGFNVAGMILNHTLGGAIIEPPHHFAANLSNLHTFSQEYYGDVPGLAPQGYIYVPTACQEGQRCKLHIALHGCFQDYERIGESYVLHAGYNKYAEANGIIVLYPQSKSTLLKPVNPDACFDWWGYSSPDYYHKSGPQIVAFRRMIEDLSGLSIN